MLNDKGNIGHSPFWMFSQGKGGLMRTIVASIGVLCFSLGVLGCSGVPDDRPAVVPVTGKITYKGEPVTGAIVTFASEKSPRPATATTGSDGRFSLTTFNTGDGAVPGEHLVTITKSEPQAAASDPAMADAPDLSKGLPTDYPTAGGTGEVELPGGGKSQLPAKYADPKAPPLKATVNATGKNEITFDLTD